MSDELERIAATLVADGKGILAADETVPTLTKRFDALGIRSTMVISGKDHPQQASVDEVATATLRCLRRHVPAAVPGIVFLSGGQTDRLATLHLNAINRLSATKPWKISLSYGRALQDSAREAWHARVENVKAAQQALHDRVRCNGAASLGAYTDELERQLAAAPDAVHRRDWHDD